MHHRRLTVGFRFRVDRYVQLRSALYSDGRAEDMTTTTNYVEDGLRG